MYSHKTFYQNAEDTNTFNRADRMTMTNWSFLQYWLYAAFPHCYGLRRYLLEYFPYSQEWMDQVFGVNKDQEITSIRQTVVIDQQVVTILLHRYYVEYRMGDQELFQPCFPYHTVEFLDNDTFFLVLPIVEMSECLNSSLKLVPDLIRRFSKTALPKENIKEVAYRLGIGLAEADGAEDEPLWVIWQETVDSLYGAEWWFDGDEGELHLFQKHNSKESYLPDVYIPAPKGEDIFLWGRRMLSEWISSLSKDGTYRKTEQE